MKARVVWSREMQFTGYPPSGHAVPMDAAPAVGGADSAARPLELVLLGLGGCTAMDVMSILRKMRKAVTSLEVELDAQQAPDHPRRLTSVLMTYRVRGRDVDEESLRRAVELSEEKYCSVAATLRLPVEVAWKLTLEREDA